MRTQATPPAPLPATTPAAITGITVGAGTEYELSFRGVRLGYGSSRRDQHTHHPKLFAEPRYKCAACRWIEVYLYRRYRDATVLNHLHINDDTTAVATVTSNNTTDYVLHTIGASRVPGETQFVRVATTESPYELLELLTVRKTTEEPFMAVQALRALAQAAQFDEGVRDAYVNRAIT